MSIFRKQNLELVLEGMKTANLKKTLGALDIMLLGIGVIIGTGIFVLTGIAAAKHSGPAISVSFGIAGLLCIFIAFVYTEMAAMAPVSGGSYSYAYLSIGEITAWYVGILASLVYIFGAAAIASGWSGYVVGLLGNAGIHIPEVLTKAPHNGGIVNLPAVGIASFLTLLLLRGMKESTILNNILVVVKMAAIFVFIIVALPSVDTANVSDFMPFGFNGVLTGASFVFLSYSGFETLANTAEECKNPTKDLPYGIIGSVVIAAILYAASSAILTAIVSYTELNNPEPMAYSLRKIGSFFGASFVAIGAVAAMTSALMMLIYCQSRMCYVMSRDGLLPKFFSTVSEKTGVPAKSTLAIGLVVILITGFVPIEPVAKLANVSMLLTFIIVIIGVMIMRKTHAHVKRVFKCPQLYFMGSITILFSLVLTLQALKGVFIPFIVLMIIATMIYLGYGYKRSELKA